MNKQRLSYRKNLKVGGTMVMDSREIQFFTKNISLNGFHACCKPGDHLEQGDIVYVRLPTLDIEGVASPVWKGSGTDDILHIGFKFLTMRGMGESAYHYKESEQRSWAK